MNFRSLVIILSAVLLVLLGYAFTAQHYRPSVGARVSEPRTAQGNREKFVYDPRHHANRYGLSRQECDAAFPGYFHEIERAAEYRKRRPIRLEELDEWLPNTLRVMIYDSELYILNRYGFSPFWGNSRGLALLSALHRAVTSANERLPNVEFSICYDDMPDPQHKGLDRAILGLTRGKRQESIWLMPDFGYWSWPETKVGAFGEVRRKIEEIEAGLDFRQKTPRLLWRGALGVNYELRKSLLDAAEHREWSDVKVLDWSDQSSKQTDLVSMPDHARYQFLAHTEGASYSGRLKYLLSATSVSVIHELRWVEPFHHLLKATGDEQNYIAVKRDFSDLTEKMEYYVAHPDEARKVAMSSKRTFRDRYLTPAAQACYWRRLVHAWSEVSFEPEFFEPINRSAGASTTRSWRGVPYESYM